MRTDKNQAFALRRQGKSYKYIAKELGVAISTLSNWFSGVDFSEEIKENLTKSAIASSKIRIEELNKVRGVTLQALYERAEHEASIELKTHLFNPLFTTAIAAYWGEGDKLTKSHIRLTNTDPKMLLLFKKFLVDICNVQEEKLKLALFIYDDIDQDQCKNFWTSQLGLARFHKTMVLPSRHKTKRLAHGICTLVVTNTYLKKKLLLWIDQMPQMVLNMVPEIEK